MLRIEQLTLIPAALAMCAWMFGAIAPAQASTIGMVGKENGSDVLCALALAHGSQGRGRPIIVPPTVGGGVPALSKTLRDHSSEAEQRLARLPGALALISGTSPLEYSKLLVPVDGKRPSEAGYSLMMTLYLAFPADSRDDAIHDRLADLGSKDARRTIIGQGAEPVLP
jgi:hypothetical protein